MFTMYDNVTLSLIPNMPHAVGCYRNGRFANEEEARRRFPHARILPISVEGRVACDCYDIEQGDYTPDDVPELFKIAREAGVWRPCFYAQLSGIMPAVRQKLSTVVAKREDVRLWVAYYNEQPDLPSWADAHQFTDRALGRSLDESICRSDFFPPHHTTPPPAAHPVTHEARITFDGKDWSIHPLAGK